jgi:hypothetical protein
MCFGSAAAWAQTSARAAPAVADPSFAVTRTPWGDPDLQGVWDYRTITPLERRPELGDRELYSDEEIAELEQRAARRMDQPPDAETPSNLVHAQYMTDPGRYVDESRRTSLIIDPPNGRIPPSTAAAAARREQAGPGAPVRTGGRADSWLDRTLLERCITRGLPGSILPGLYNNNIRVSQAPGFVAIVHEMVHETRIVPLDGSPFTGMRGYMGESRGRWEGDTLVVETRNFNGKAGFRGSSGENMRLTERYTRVGPDTIDFRLTIEDDTQWTAPWTVAYLMRPAEGELYEYACHEGNYGLRNILENARAEERAAAEAAE